MLTKILDYSQNLIQILTSQEYYRNCLLSYWFCWHIRNKDSLPHDYYICLILPWTKHICYVNTLNWLDDYISYADYLKKENFNVCFHNSSCALYIKPRKFNSLIIKLQSKEKLPLVYLSLFETIDGKHSVNKNLSFYSTIRDIAISILLPLLLNIRVII